MIGQILAGWFLADLGGGLHHCLVDHLKPTVPWIGRMVMDFNEHHDNRLSMDQYSRWPSFFQSLVGGSLALIPAYFGYCPYLCWTVLLGACLTQHAHYYAHTKERPFVVRVLQQLGIFISPEAHERHHSDFERSYGVLNGWSHGFLDLLFGRLYA